MEPSLLFFFILSLVHGFAPSGSCVPLQKHRDHRRQHCIEDGTLNPRYSLIETYHHQPRAPHHTIDVDTLLKQVKKLLTFKDLKSLLSSRGKSSGNKAHLLSELGRLLGTNETAPIPKKPEQRKPSIDGTEYRYRRMTVKELRNELRQRGLKVSGRKTELVQRLLDSDAAHFASDNPSSKKENSRLQHDDDCEEWSVLKTSISEFNHTTTFYDIDVEMPIHSSLLFVNKPCGMSTLPTREVEGYPTFPCLSELVKEWLNHHPDGVQMLVRARKEEEQFWNYTLAEIDQSSNRKLFKKKTRQREKLLEKELTFEPRPVHRLDIDTSGIVCIALTPYALRTAGMLFEQKSVQSGSNIESNTYVEKKYVALVEGHMEAPETDEEKKISHSIGKVWISDAHNAITGHHEWACDILGDESVAFCRHGDRERKDPLKFVEGSVRDALTSYEVIDTGSNATLIELIPHTGRGHQLRLHMASLGHPIIGELLVLFFVTSSIFRHPLTLCRTLQEMLCMVK